MSVFSIGALVGALLSGLLSDLAGRKVTMIVGASLYALGGTIQTSSFFLWSVIHAAYIAFHAYVVMPNPSGHTGFAVCVNFYLSRPVFKSAFPGCSSQPG